MNPIWVIWHKQLGCEYTMASLDAYVEYLNPKWCYAWEVIEYLGYKAFTEKVSPWR